MKLTKGTLGTSAALCIAAVVALSSQSCGSDNSSAGTGGGANTGGAAGSSGAAGQSGSAGTLNWTEEVGRQASGANAMVVSSNPAAARVGADILKQGGNAVDAAIAVQFALNVVEPMMSGIGGGCFVVVYDAKKDEVRVVNARERAPSGATPGMFLGTGGTPIPFSQRVTSGKSIGVPGTAKAMEIAHQTWGTRPWAELVAPAIALAKDGSVVGGRLAQSISGSFSKLDPTARAVFAPTGTPAKATDILKQPDLANTLQLIADGGADAFYTGPVAEALASAVQASGGSMTAADVAEYAKTGAEVVAPIEATVSGGLTLRSVPPPSSGGILVAQILGMLDSLNVGNYAKDSVEKHHLQIEASRLAYADRFAHIGDPRFVTVPPGLLSPAYIKARAGLVSLSAANPNPMPGNPSGTSNAAPSYISDSPAFGHTTHFTVADRWGNVVALTSTIEQVFGSGHMVPGYGFMLNNELTDFSAVPGGPNQIEAGKQPVSSMSPMIVFKDGKPAFTLGAAGGLTIITSVFQTFQNLATFKLAVPEAVEEPRTFGALYPDVAWETGMPQATRSGLSALGHSVDSGPSVLSNLQAMTIDSTGFHGAADSSAPDGVAIGLSIVP